jgi:spore coat polysaccharide biosynthesis protein SpsF
LKTVAIVQARVGSSRLPAKVLLDLGGQPALARCLARVRRIAGVDDVVVATSDTPVDDPVAALARRLAARVFRGSEHDVLARYVGAARAAGAAAVVRVTADCPLLDPAVSAAVVGAFRAARAAGDPVDYASNVLERRLPRGLDTEVVAAEALERAHRDAAGAAEREHVTLHIYRHPERFRLRAVAPPGARGDLSHHRWTLDTLDDYRFLAAVYDALGDAAATAGLDEVLAVLAAHPQLVGINAHVEQTRA